VEFDCKCCGHTDKKCACPNRPGDFDVCYPRIKFVCTRCGRAYRFPLGPGVDLPDDACLHESCSGIMKRIGKVY
jgi:hypothetical protein